MYFKNSEIVYFHHSSRRYSLPRLSFNVSKSVGAARPIIQSRRNIANPLLYGTSEANKYKLQRLRDSHARILFTFHLHASSASELSYNLLCNLPCT